MRPFKDFVENKIAVSFKNENEVNSFLQLCYKNGLEWFREPIPKREIEKLSPISYFYFNALGYSSNGIESESLKMAKIIPASEFLSNNKETDIRITSHGKTTVCLKYEDGKVVARGVARCNPDDKWDADFGAKLAFDRMMGREEKQTKPKIKTLKDGTRIVKQDKYEVGDVVLIKKNPSKSSGCEHFGKKAEITKIRKKNGSYQKEDGYLIDLDHQIYRWFNQDIKGKVLSDQS